MISIRNTLSTLLILCVALTACSADETNSSPQVKNEQIESCVVGDDYSLGKNFLNDFGIKTDGFDNAPVDVKCFVEDAAMCEHFAGEEPYDAERKKEIVLALTKYCSAARSKLKVLETKYKDQDVKKILTVCENKSNAVCASFDPRDFAE